MRPYEPVEPPEDPAARAVPMRERAAGAVAAVAPLVRGIGAVAFRFGVLTLGAGAVIWWWAFSRVPERGVVALTVLALVLAAPPAFLVFLWAVLRAVAALPERLRRAPEAMRSQAGEVVRLAEEMRRARQRGWARSALTLLRLRGTVRDTGDLLQFAAPLALLFNPWTLLGTVVAAIVAPLEILAGLILLLAVVLP